MHVFLPKSSLGVAFTSSYLQVVKPSLWGHISILSIVWPVGAMASTEKNGRDMHNKWDACHRVRKQSDSTHTGKICDMVNSFR